MVMPHLEEGRLVEVLSQWKPSPLPISVVYLHNRHLSPKVRAFVDWVAELFSTCPLHRACTMGMDKVEGECRFVDKTEPSTVRTVVEQHNIAESVF
jgi:LysR family transcriptional regulator for bpeEF and oprC